MPQNKEEDDKKPSRVDKVHGGEIVESIGFDELESFNDATCKHPELVRDETEKDFIAYTCANSKCNEVFIYGKIDV